MLIPIKVHKEKNTTTCYFRTAVQRKQFSETDIKKGNNSQNYFQNYCNMLIVSKIKKRQTDTLYLLGDSELSQNSVQNYTCRIILSMYFFKNGIISVKAVLQRFELPLLILFA